MKRIIGILAISCLASSACRDEEGVALDDTLRIYPPDEEVMAKVYDNTYNGPEGFFVDERANTARSYTVYHVKDASMSYELCTDNFDQALSWESADNISRSVNGEYVDSYENDRYFEIIRELEYPDGVGNITDPTSPGFSRIFKCSYVNRDDVDRNVRDGYAGILNKRPRSEEAARTFVEYMWQFTFFWPAQKTVLASFSGDRANAFQHTLMLGFVTNQGFDKCDLVEVVDWVFTVNKDDGRVTKEFIHLYQFEAQLINELPERCD